MGLLLPSSFSGTLDIPVSTKPSQKASKLNPTIVSPIQDMSKGILMTYTALDLAILSQNIEDQYNPNI